jgi:hypothetical protein
MSLVSFAPDLLPSPFVSLDQWIISLVYGSDYVENGDDFSFFLVPKLSVLSPLSVLWAVYANLYHRTDIKRIIYIRTDDIPVIVWSKDDGIDFVLGQTMYYDNEYYSNIGFIKEYQNEFYLNDEFWATHVFYSRFLQNIKLVPIVLPNSVSSSSIKKQLIKFLDNIKKDENTVCIIANNNKFVIDEKSHVKFINEEKVSHNDMLFYDYCIEWWYKPHLIQSEVLQWDVCNWVFAF